jgi:hypothetical protein
MPGDRGRQVIEGLLGTTQLERVVPSGELGGRLMHDARTHLASARSLQEADPAGAYQLAYDAARKACSALLAVQGLRATSRGGHIAVQEAVREQFGPEFAAFARMRRRRRESEYPDVNTPTIVHVDAAEGIEQASAIVQAAGGLIASGAVGPFG